MADNEKPDGYIPSHLLIPHPQGRILSDSTGKTVQYGAACNPAGIKLPSKTGRTGHILTGEPRAVSCEACRKTEAFAKVYKEVVGEDYDQTKCPVLNPQPVEIGGMNQVSNI